LAYFPLFWYRYCVKINLATLHSQFNFLTIKFETRKRKFVPRYETALRRVGNLIPSSQSYELHQQRHRCSRLERFFQRFLFWVDVNFQQFSSILGEKMLFSLKANVKIIFIILNKIIRNISANCFGKNISSNHNIGPCGLCYDHNFVRFLPILCEKMAFLSKTNVMIKYFQKTSRTYIV
jgi:hypothetical protein